MNCKLSLLSAAVIMALAATPADARQYYVLKRTVSVPGGQTTGGHFHHGSNRGGDTVLYDQTHTSYTTGITDQYSSSSSAFNDAAADDFVVSDASGWTVDTVAIPGAYFNGSGPATSFDVTFYADAGGLPGAAVCSAPASSFTTAADPVPLITDFSIALSTPCDLPQGNYWVSPVANLNFTEGGQFGWETYNTSAGAAAVWQNPGGGYGVGCATWANLASCLVGSGTATAFQIIGHPTIAETGISLTVGVAVDNGDPTQCGTATTLSANVGDSVNFCYTVSNNSTTVLNYHTLVDDVPQTLFRNLAVVLNPGASYRYNRTTRVIASATIDSTWTAADELPGYTHATGTAAFADISASGTALNTSDDGYANVTMPFSFNFYGSTSNQLAVNNNGFILFGTSASGFGNLFNASLPTSIFSAPFLMPFWDDLYIGGNVYAQAVGTPPNRQFIVEYFQKNHYDDGADDPGGITFDVVFNEGGSIDFVYDTVEFDAQGGINDFGLSATVGLQFDPTTANQFSYDTASLSDGLDIRWTTAAPTVYAASASVTLDVGAPLLALTPATLSAAAVPGSSATATLSIGNTGDRDLNWNLGEAVGGTKAHFPRHPVVLAQHSSRPASRFRAPTSSSVDRKSRPTPAGTYTVPAYGESFNSSSSFAYVNFDASAPDNSDTVATLTRQFFAATFANDDFTVEYALESPTGELVAINTADGTIQNIAGTGLASSVTGMRWDATSGITYVMSVDDNGSQLYTLDLVSGAKTAVGAPVSGTLIIDIAIDPTGLMYGVDITADALIAIDKSTGEQAVIGPLGFDANFAEGLDFDPSSGILYFAGYDIGAGSAGMYTIDTVTGLATLRNALPAELDAFAIAVPSPPCTTPNDVPWLSEDPVSGTTVAGGADAVTVTFDSTGLAAGVYTATVCVRSDDLTNRQVAVPVTFTVTDNDTIFADGFDAT